MTDSKGVTQQDKLRYIIFTVGESDALVEVHHSGDECPSHADVLKMRDGVARRVAAGKPITTGDMVAAAMAGAGYANYKIIYTGELCRVEL